MKKIILTMLLILPLISFNSCNEELILKPENSEKRILTDEEIKSIGEQHNNSLLLAFDKFNWNSKDKFAELTYHFNQLDISKDNNVNFNKPPKKLEDNLQLIKDGLNDKSNFIYFEQVINFIHNSKGKNVLDIELFLDITESDIRKSTKHIRDYETFLVFSSVIRSSAKFWLPVKKGGLGKFRQYKKLENDYKKEKETEDNWRDCLTDVLVADGVSAGAGFIVGAGALAVSTGPAAPLVFIGAIAAESGLSSGWEYLSSDNC